MLRIFSYIVKSANEKVEFCLALLSDSEQLFLFSNVDWLCDSHILLLLVDDRAGRRIAEKLNIATTGLVGRAYIYCERS